MRLQRKSRCRCALVTPTAARPVARHPRIILGPCPFAATASSLGQRQDPARRHHRSREPQLRQSVSRFSRRRHEDVRLHEHRRKGRRFSRSASKPRGTSITRPARFLPRATARARYRERTAGWTASTRSGSAADIGYPPCPNPNPQYSYVPHSEPKPYFEMGKAVRARRQDVRVELRREQFHLASVHHRGSSEFRRRLSEQHAGAARRSERQDLRR